MGYPMRWEETVVTPLLDESPGTEEQRYRPALHVWVLLMAAAMGIAVLALAALAVLTLLQRAQQPPALRLESAPAGAHVALASSTATRRVGFVVVSGDVVNHTSQPLTNVEAVVDLLDANQHTVKMESSLIGMDPLPSGSTSPFQVELMDDSRAVTYRVHFKRLLGAPLD